MIVFHEANPDTVESVKEHGLRCTSRGEKGDDTTIVRTDEILDNYCPDGLRSSGVSRDNNLYAYIYVEGDIIRITDGERVPEHTFITDSDRAVFRINADAERCYVSDLDSYDKIKNAVADEAQENTIQTLAQEYWSKVLPLTNFSPGAIKRPEVMITYDVPPEAIEIVKAR